MAYLTESQLKGFATTLNKNTTRANLKVFRISAKVSIFLSHSHRDRKLAQGLVFFLASQGIELYADWNDSEMPEITNRTTADKIKGKIRDND